MLHWRHWNFWSEKPGEPDWAWVFGLSRYVRMHLDRADRIWARYHYDRCIEALQNHCIPELLAANPYLTDE